MPWLHVTLRFHDAVVEQRLCAVTDELVLGDQPNAEVAFPGCRLRVRRFGERLQVEGRWLDLGQRLEVCKPPISVEIEPVAPRPQPFSFDWVPDVRLLVATGAVVLIGAWFETATRLVEANPAAVERVTAALQGWSPAGGDRGPRVSGAQPARAPTAVLDAEDSAAPGAEGSHARYEGVRPAPDDPLDERSEDRWPPAVFLTLE